MSKFTPWTTNEVIDSSMDYAEKCDNESGGFLSHQLVQIRAKAYYEGVKWAGAQIEKCETIHSCSENNYLTVWFKQPGSSDTHQAKLVGVREVGK